MVIRPRPEPMELKILSSLNIRMELLENDKQNYFHIKKGYEGEVLFDSMTEKLKCECFILNDLLLKVNNSYFQIDTLIIVQGKIHLFEVKNYEGDYFFENESLFTRAKSLVKNPVHQLKRSDSLLRQLLQNLGFHFPIEAWVVHINLEFTLYQSPLYEPNIFPTQVNRYLKKLDRTPSKLNEKHKKLADKLISLHIEKSPFKIIPDYDYKQLKKGITCALCHSFLISICGNKCVCDNCGYEEQVESAVMRNVEELKLLFPNLKITTAVVFDWCKVIECKKKISRILKKNFKIVETRHYAFYE